MGKSSSCFKIITCGNSNDSADQDDLHPTESNRSNDKRGWSFRKKSASHRVLSNSVISETQSTVNKQSPESAVINFQATANPSVPEKISVLPWPDEKPGLPTLVDVTDEKPGLPTSVDVTDEKPELSTAVDVTDEKPKLFTSQDVTETVVVTENESETVSNVDESVVIVIQAAIRGFLAKRELGKHKAVMKLQAAVRGHLVRRHAVGTLRCVQAIVKMQALVRARHARLALERSSMEEKTDKKHEKDYHEKRVSRTKPEVSYISIEKLLSNRFARQLLDSSPNSTINIKCDTSKPNSAWNWLERWMSASSLDTAESQRPDLITERKEQEEIDDFSSQEKNEDLHKVCEPADLKSTTREPEAAVENEENFSTLEENNVTIQACLPHSSSSGNDLEEHKVEKTGNSDSTESTFEIDSYSSQPEHTDPKSQIDINTLSAKPEIEAEQSTDSMKIFSSELLDIKEKHFVPESGKASNPAFIAAQSKSKELTAPANLARSKSSSSQDVDLGSSIDAATSGVDVVNGKEEISEAENLVHQNSSYQISGSECGTELSISSTLDTFDRSDAGYIEIQHEGKVLEEGACVIDDLRSAENESVVVFPIPVQQKELEQTGGETGNSIADVEPTETEQKLERRQSNLPTHLDSETGNQAYRTSPEASPKSHVTFPESQGTPSSELSTKAKRSQTNKIGSYKKGRSLTAGKRSPLNSNHDSGSRNGVEQVPKDQKAAKRRNSFGSAKPDHVDQERRDSSSSNSLPSYMQATESARAKAHANNSPRSSPDVLDKDLYLKKRHSLPGANGRHGSPRIQQSPPQVQQERKWLR